MEGQADKLAETVSHPAQLSHSSKSYTVQRYKNAVYIYILAMDKNN